MGLTVLRYRALFQAVFRVIENGSGYLFLMAMYPCCRVGRVLKYLARDKPPLGFDNIVPQPSDVAANHQVSEEFGKRTKNPSSNQDNFFLL